uniref:Rab-GAP TBC domain-containing protein n=1 Tax=Macrostomum lignano TaxID=282301 RepID=A0A1I8FPQ1_9PLAT
HRHVSFGSCRSSSSQSLQRPPLLSRRSQEPGCTSLPHDQLLVASQSKNPFDPGRNVFGRHYDSTDSWRTPWTREYWLHFPNVPGSNHARIAETAVRSDASIWRTGTVSTIENCRAVSERKALAMRLIEPIDCLTLSMKRRLASRPALDMYHEMAARRLAGARGERERERQRLVAAQEAAALERSSSFGRADGDQQERGPARLPVLARTPTAPASTGAPGLAPMPRQLTSKARRCGRLRARPHFPLQHLRCSASLSDVVDLTSVDTSNFKSGDFNIRGTYNSNGSSSTNRSTLPSNRSAKGSSGGGISDVGLPSPSDSSNREFAPEARALCWNLLDDFINWYRKGRVVIGGDTVAKQKQLRPIQEDPEASAACTATAAAGVDLDGLEDESSDVVGPQLVRSQGSFKHQHPYQHQASSNSQQHRRTPSHRVCYYSPVRTPLLILLSFKSAGVDQSQHQRVDPGSGGQLGLTGCSAFAKTAKQKHREMAFSNLY